jgi:hypothetical protein
MGETYTGITFKNAYDAGAIPGFIPLEGQDVIVSPKLEEAAGVYVNQRPAPVIAY